MRLSFPIFTENRERDFFQSPNREMKYPKNVIFSNREI